MTKTKWLVAALLVVLVFGLILAACGTDETTTTVAPVTTAPPTTAPPTSDTTPTTAPPTSDTTPTTVGAPTETLKIGASCR